MSTGLTGNAAALPVAVLGTAMAATAPAAAEAQTVRLPGTAIVESLPGMGPLLGAA